MRSRLQELTSDAQQQLRLLDHHERCSAEYRISASRSLYLLRQWVEAGEAGEIKWWDYYKANFTHGRRAAERLLKIASAEDPEAALALERKYNAQQAFASRARKAREASDLRQSQNVVNLAVSRIEPGPKTVDLVVSRLTAPCPGAAAEPVRLVYGIVQQALDLVERMTAEEFAEFYSQIPAPSGHAPNIEITLARRRH